MNSILRRNLLKKCLKWSYSYAKRKKSTELQYDLTQEINVTHFKKVLIIGINLPSSSNALNDSALIKLNASLKEFNSNDQFSVAVLHGIGGNFCTGLQSSVNPANAEAVLMTLKDLEKPTVVSLAGRTVFFGFQLAIMCDFRVMENNAVMGLGYKTDRGILFPIVRERLINITNVVVALDLALTSSPLNQSECFAYGLVNRLTDVGSGLGNTVNFATTIAKFPLEDIIKERSLIYSCLPKR